MKSFLISNDPILSALLNNITASPVSCSENRQKNKNFNAKSAKIFLENLGISKSNIRLVVKDLFKDIKFMEALERKIRRSKKESSFNRLSIYFLSKLQVQTADLIVKNILVEDVNEKDLVYAKLHLLRKFKENCKYSEVYNLLLERFKIYENIDRSTKMNTSTGKKPINSNVIYFSDYIFKDKNR